MGDMDRGTKDKTDERSYWAGLDASHRRGLVIAVGSLVAVVALLVTGWFLFAGGGTPARDVDSKIVGGPAASEATSTSEVSTDAAETTSSDAANGAGVAHAGREPFIAYRLDGALWVAGEDGGAAARVTQAPAGSFALSPDGKTLAIVDMPAGRLRLVDVASGSERSVPGSATDVGPPSWSPDSTWVAYTAAGARLDVARVNADGSGAQTLVASAYRPRVSPDGRRVAYALPQASAGDALLVADVGKGAGTMLVPDGVSDFTWAGSSIAYSRTLRDVPPEVRVMRADGSGDIELFEYTGRRPVAIADMVASPDGTRVLFAETGDDGYSRMWVAATDGSGKRFLSVRRDDYPLGWSAAGEWAYFIQGNARQGDPTALMRVRPDATGLTVVVDGAAR